MKVGNCKQLTSLEHRGRLLSVVRTLFTLQRLKRHFSQGAKFILCGVTGLLTEVFFLLPFLIERLQLSEEFAGFLSGLVMVVFVFFFNKYVTFQNREKRFGSQTLKFVLVYSIAFLFNNIIYIIGLNIFGHEHYQLAKIVAIGIVAVWNYSCSHLFVFRRRADADGHTS